uniref:DUF3881 family protein n=1 Tax=Eubacterium cellulosolvens TaxID=29322 RepID=UPI0004816B70|nr:DUF3881 family protein [[Eubacterium] cellulosolvens]
MHKYLKAIGFSQLKELDDQDRLIQDVLSHYDFKKVIENEDHQLFAEISREYAPNAGITVCGLYDEDNLFHMEYYYPHFWGSQVTTYEQVTVERHIATESYAAACDDMRVGTTLIFYLNNASEYLSLRDSGVFKEVQASVTLAALADSGSILMPVRKEKKPVTENPEKAELRNSLVNAAQNGDQKAIESLTMEDIDAYTTLTNRVKHEDIYTIVDSYFMPYGMECDLYSILGDITAVEKNRNAVTDEEIWQMSILCNEVPMDVCINAKDLLGEPAVGRRFKGSVWLQGRVDI